MTRPNVVAKPRVLIDADALFAGAASPFEHSASLVVLRMAEITLIEALASEQVVTEVERNLQDKFPQALPGLRFLVQRCLQVVLDPEQADIREHEGRAIEDARESIARLINAHTGEIVFTAGATESNNLAILGLARAAIGYGRDRIVTTALEHKAVLMPCWELEKEGYEVITLPSEPDGCVSINSAREAINDRTLWFPFRWRIMRLVANARNWFCLYLGSGRTFTFVRGNRS